jgi:hypothetical protein
VTFRPDYLRPAFEVVCAGYLEAPRWALETMLADLDALGRPVSLREYAIRSAIAWQIGNWAAARALREPVVLERRPAV